METLSALAFRGYAEYRLGNVSTAPQTLQTALENAVEIEGFISKAFAATFCLPWIADLGETGQVIELYAALHQLPLIRNSVFCKDLIGRQIESLAGEMPQNTVKAARERGQGQDLNTVTAKIFAIFKAHPIG